MGATSPEMPWGDHPEGLGRLGELGRSGSGLANATTDLRQDPQPQEAACLAAGADSTKRAGRRGAAEGPEVFTPAAATERGGAATRAEATEKAFISGLGDSARRSRPFVRSAGRGLGGWARVRFIEASCFDAGDRAEIDVAARDFLV